VHLDPGDVAVVRGPGPYTVADDPATPPQIVIQPGQVSTTLDGAELCPFALSAAFKRVRGVSPQQFRSRSA
jgi:hypothetical protein